jgi:hypothetical protein
MLKQLPVEGNETFSYKLFKKSSSGDFLGVSVEEEFCLCLEFNDPIFFETTPWQETTETLPQIVCSTR